MKYFKLFLLILVLMFSACENPTSSDDVTDTETESETEAEDNSDTETDDESTTEVPVEVTNAKTVLQGMPELSFDLPSSLAGTQASSSSSGLARSITTETGAGAGSFSSVDSMSSQNLRAQLEMANGYIMIVNYIKAQIAASSTAQYQTKFTLGGNLTCYIKEASETNLELVIKMEDDYLYFVVTVASDGIYTIEVFMDSSYDDFDDAMNPITSTAVNYILLTQGSSIETVTKETSGDNPIQVATKALFNSDDSLTMYMDFIELVDDPSVFYASSTMAWGNSTQGGIFFDFNYPGQLVAEYKDYSNSTGELVLEYELDPNTANEYDKYQLKHLLPLQGTHAGKSIISLFDDNDTVDNNLDDTFTVYIDENDNDLVDVGTDTDLDVETGQYLEYNETLETLIMTPGPYVKKTAGTAIDLYYSFPYSTEVSTINTKLDALAAGYSFSGTDYNTKLTGVSAELRALVDE